MTKPKPKAKDRLTIARLLERIEWAKGEGLIDDNTEISVESPAHIIGNVEISVCAWAGGCAVVNPRSARIMGKHFRIWGQTE